MKYVISIEGQELEMPEEIAGDDAKLKSALAPYFPAASNAKIMREPEKDGVIKVQVIKQAGTKGAGTKGNSILDKLIAAPEGENPAITLWRRLTEKASLDGLDEDQLLDLDAEIEKTLKPAQKERDGIDRTLELLEAAPAAAIADPMLMEGF